MRPAQPNPRHRLRRIACALLTCAVLAGISQSYAAEAALDRQDQFKAAYLFNFVKFVEWPATSAHDQEQLTVCFLGGEGVYRALAMGIDDKRVGARRLAARQVNSGEALSECHAVYFDAQAQAQAQLGGLRELPVLTISDASQFTSKDGMIELFLDSNRLRFNINVDNAHKSGLRISSSLLQLAASVQRNP
jgi:hypothetical protein